MKGLYKLSILLLVIGGLNWLLVALFGKGVVEMLGLGTTIGKIIYILVGLAALIVIFTRRPSVASVQ
ncbi:MAG: DUF378 domain-containing protein [Parcubacteria group bacterium]